MPSTLTGQQQQHGGRQAAITYAEEREQEGCEFEEEEHLHAAMMRISSDDAEGDAEGAEGATQA